MSALAFNVGAYETLVRQKVLDPLVAIIQQVRFLHFSLSQQLNHMMFQTSRTPWLRLPEQGQRPELCLWDRGGIVQRTCRVLCELSRVDIFVPRFLDLNGHRALVQLLQFQFLPVTEQSAAEVLVNILFVAPNAIPDVVARSC